MDARMRRSATLAVALWGKAIDDLQCQLLSPYPKILAGFNLVDLRELQRIARQASSINLSHPRFAWLRHLAHAHEFTVISAGTQRFTLWAARCEVVDRAIAFLEHQK